MDFSARDVGRSHIMAFPFVTDTISPSSFYYLFPLPAAAAVASAKPMAAVSAALIVAAFPSRHARGQDTNRQHSVADAVSVDRLNGTSGIFISRHVHQAKATRRVGELVGHDPGAEDDAGGGKKIVKLLIGHGFVNIADMQSVRHELCLAFSRTR